MVFQFEAKSQVFYVGFNAGANYSWFESPTLNYYLPELDTYVPISFSSEGYGWNAGFFLRYGKRPYYQAGFDWSRANNDFNFSAFDTTLAEKAAFHNFDFSVKVGYEIIQKPYFKWSLLGGPFIGRSLFFNSDLFQFKNSDFKNPQFGVIGGTCFQVTNFNVTLEYSYHFTNLFKPITENGNTYDLGSNLQMITVKVGMQF
jgi:hypothetical protein